MIERALIVRPGPVPRLADSPDIEAFVSREGWPRRLRAVEWDHILRVLEETGWNIDGEGGAASALGLHPSTLRFRLKKLSIKRP